MRKLLFIGGGSALLLLAILFGVFFAGPLLASANSGSGQTTATSTSTTTNPYCEQYLQDLANRLNVSVSTLQSDKLAAAEDVLAQLVKDGKLTQKEANVIQKRLESRQACTGKGIPFERAVIKNVLGQQLSGIVSDVAQGLHLTVAQLKADLQAGQSLNQIAAAQKVSSAQLHTIVTNAIQNALNRAVGAGAITQSQETTYMQFLKHHPLLLNHLLNRHFGKSKATTTTNQ
jgi:polyhydroxyalkanoate synthesis regulator phasin